LPCGALGCARPHPAPTGVDETPFFTRRCGNNRCAVAASPGARAAARSSAHLGLVPFDLVEFWGQGHMDACLAALLVASLLAARRERWALAGLLLSAGGLIKYWPFLLLPLFATHGRRPWWRWRWRVVLAGIPLVLLFFWPYRAALPDLVGRNASFA